MYIIHIFLQQIILMRNFIFNCLIIYISNVMTLIAIKYVEIKYIWRKVNISFFFLETNYRGSVCISASVRFKSRRREKVALNHVHYRRFIKVTKMLPQQKLFVYSLFHYESPTCLFRCTVWLHAHANFFFCRNKFK